ncbi:response regulator transcription factor [Dyadobacter sp. MSC1_007]|jgi:DNA-binding NarL/FixJ family response regulator|uniref:response regulator transcription factor n=1 Tax=Dyadobacter sp. MSC1_007 TaxID=2909264 RepID=UPI00202F8905|nr:response regulator transcription factor [Dyadobacter sp. MSC1_007]
MNVLIIEDSPLLLNSFRSSVLKEYPQSRIFEVDTIEECAPILRDNPFKLLILDINVSDGHDMDTVASIRNLYPKLPILVYLAEEYVYLAHFIQSGANGFISKKSTANEIQDALTTVSAGNRYLSGDVQEFLLMQLVPKGGQPTLSRTERIVAQMLADNKSYDQVASVLGVKRSTIAVYKRRVFHKLGVKNMLEFFKKMLSVY